jgi:hypothetical protein
VSDENCGNCYFYRQRKLSDYTMPSGSYVCMRFPSAMPPRGEVVEYPLTTRHDWCGEHAEKP